MKLAIVFVLGALGCASSSATTVGRTPEGAPIVQIPLRLSNAFLVKTTPPVLVDSGTAGDLKELDEALSENGTLAQRLGLVVITHAHADHAGVAADLQRLGSARIMIGAGDSDRARTGKNDELLPTGFTASVLKPFIPNDFWVGNLNPSNSAFIARSRDRTVSLRFLMCGVTAFGLI